MCSAAATMQVLLCHALWEVGVILKDQLAIVNTLCTGGCIHHFNAHEHELIEVALVS